MESYHLSLVGAQPMPVYNGICYAKPDKVFLLHSNETYDKAQIIKNAIEIECKLVLVTDPNSFSEIYTKVSALFENNMNVDWSVNLVGGTKTMALLTNEIATKCQAKRFIIDQNNIVHFFENTTEEFVNQLNIETYFKLANQKKVELKKFENLDSELFEFTDYIIENMTDFEPIQKEFAFLKLCEKTDLKLTKNDVIVKWKASTQKLSIEHNQIIEKRGLVFFNIFFYTAWFELFTLREISKWNKINELYWDSKAIFEKTGKDKNQFDIIINTPKKLFFIECKKHTKEPKELDKFNNVTKIFGGLGAKAFLVTFLPPSSDVLEKCKENAISVFTYSSYKSYFSNKTTSLIKVLETEYNKTNPK